MTRHEEILESAIQSMRNDELNAAQVSDSARRVGSRLGIDALTTVSDNTPVIAIDNCAGVERLLKPWEAGELSESRALMIEAHLRDCGPCFRLSRSTTGARSLDWTVPQAASVFTWRPKVFGWILAPTLALLAVGFFVYQAYWQVPPGVRAEVISIDGSASRISASGDRPLVTGDKLTEGDELRTAGGAHAVIRLTDGSTVEINERSMLGVGARGRSMTVTLDNGGVIVQAAKRTSGHLYVNTPDSRLAVTGTVFSVNAGIKGSRVAVLQGSVHMIHAGLDTTLHAGDQQATYDNLNPAPMQDQVAQQISWSQDREKYLPLLAQFADLQRKLEAVPFPRPRYSSDLLEHVPADTLLYISIPNLGDYLSEANKVFQDQLKQSPVLQQWWDHGHAGQNADPTTDLNSLIAKLHQMSEYIGDEVVIVGLKQNGKPGFAVIADLQKPGLDDFLRTQLPTSDSKPGLTILNEATLASTTTAQTHSGGYAVIGQHQAIFSNSIATLKQIQAQLTAAPSSFAAGNFGQQITAAYSRGAGVILAADLHEMIASQPATNQQSLVDRSGMSDVEYLVAEHRELNGLPQNHLNVTFSGPRQRVASWLAAPAPVGSLAFVTPNAALVVAALSKDPKAIADDLMAMAVSQQGTPDGIADTEAKLQLNFRDDLAANLGGDFLLALDGPVLPMPSWKAVIEVRNPDQLESTLERLTQSLSNFDKNAHTIVIQPSEVGSQRYYAIVDQTLGHTVADYTFSAGYMILAPDRALLIEALHTQSSGDSLARSATFKASLPKDENENYSAIAYQNLNPVLTPLLSQLSGDSARAIQQLAADARPTTICAWGRDSHIEAASDSHLFGFEFLTLGTLMHSGNNKALPNVRN
jgi:hypothetical protein